MYEDETGILLLMMTYNTHGSRRRIPLQAGKKTKQIKSDHIHTREAVPYP